MKNYKQFCNKYVYNNASHRLEIVKQYSIQINGYVNFIITFKLRIL